MGRIRTIGDMAVRKRSSEIDHAVTAIGVADNGGIVLVDYPELATTLRLDALADTWDGAAILVSRSENRGHALSSRPVSLVVLAFIGVGVIAHLTRKYLQRIQTEVQGVER